MQELAKNIKNQRQKLKKVLKYRRIIFGKSLLNTLEKIILEILCIVFKVGCDIVKLTQMKD